jgi:hypothetical protein
MTKHQRERSSSSDRESDSRRKSDDGWKTAGKKKKRERKKKEKEDDDKPSSSRSAEPKSQKSTANKAGGTLKERIHLRDRKVGSGQVNVIKGEGGRLIRTPYHKPAALTKDNRNKAPANTRAAAAAAPSTGAGNTTYAQITRPAGENYEVKVVRKDKGSMTREDQWRIQFGVSQSILEASKSGQAGQNLAHSGTKLNTRDLTIYCGPQAGPFYKEAVRKIRGYEAYLPGERKPGHEIYTSLPGIAEPILANLHEHFAAGSFGAINTNQVFISRKAWRPPNEPNSNWHVYLEIDDEALEWLRTKNWLSPLGLYVAFWEHPRVAGITGRIAPGTDIRALRAKLQEEAAAETNQAQNNTIIQVPSLSEVRMPNSETQGDIRSRHVTGEAENKSDDETESVKLLNNLPELEAYNPQEITQEMEQELLEISNSQSTPRQLPRVRTTSGSKRFTPEPSKTPEDSKEEKRSRWDVKPGDRRVEGEITMSDASAEVD